MENGDCIDCCKKRFFIDMFESPKSIEQLWKFKGWSAEVYDTKSALQESEEYLHVEILKKNFRINMGIKKKDGSDDEFQIWIGDKQFVVKAEKVQEIHADCGKVVSVHKSNEILE